MTMRLPNSQRLRVDRAKISDYLLALHHPDGRGKALFFRGFGYKSEEWETLAEALKSLGNANPVTATVESPHGTRYIVDGPLLTPDGRTPRVRTVWIVEPGEASPRLITAHPL